MEQNELMQQRSQMVVKSNDLIQRSRHQFTIVQQKILYYMISKIKPGQTEFTFETFEINDFAAICGISTGGPIYASVKEAIQELARKTMWIKMVEGDDSETLVRWIEKAEISKKTGKIRIKLDDNLQPFLLELTSKYTQFMLGYPLSMKSKYSIRLYELLKSYQNLNDGIIFSLDHFKTLMSSDYERWTDVRRRVLAVAVEEINALTDIDIYYETRKKNREVSTIIFTVIEKKDFDAKIIATKNRFDVFNKPKKAKPAKKDESYAETLQKSRETLEQFAQEQEKKKLQLLEEESLNG